jgi:hypothetical protein
VLPHIATAHLPQQGQDAVARTLSKDAKICRRSFSWIPPGQDGIDGLPVTF